MCQTLSIEIPSLKSQKHNFPVVTKPELPNSQNALKGPSLTPRSHKLKLNETDLACGRRKPRNFRTAHQAPPPPPLPGKPKLGLSPQFGLRLSPCLGKLSGKMVQAHNLHKAQAVSGTGLRCSMPLQRFLNHLWALEHFAHLLAAGNAGMGVGGNVGGLGDGGGGTQANLPWCNEAKPKPTPSFKGRPRFGHAKSTAQPKPEWQDLIARPWLEMFAVVATVGLPTLFQKNPHGRVVAETQGVGQRGIVSWRIGFAILITGVVARRCVSMKVSPRLPHEAFFRPPLMPVHHAPLR